MYCPKQSLSLMKDGSTKLSATVFQPTLTVAGIIADVANIVSGEVFFFDDFIICPFAVICFI
jgi:hypothetical protein